MAFIDKLDSTQAPGITEMLMLSGFRDGDVQFSSTARNNRVVVEYSLVSMGWTSALTEEASLSSQFSGLSGGRQQHASFSF